MQRKINWKAWNLDRNEELNTDYLLLDNEGRLIVPDDQGGYLFDGCNYRIILVEDNNTFGSVKIENEQSEQRYKKLANDFEFSTKLTALKFLIDQKIEFLFDHWVEGDAPPYDFGGWRDEVVTDIALLILGTKDPLKQDATKF